MAGNNLHKVVILGDENSGKTALRERLIQNKFTEVKNPIKGVDFEKIKVGEVQLQIWDIHNLYEAFIIERELTRTSLVIICCDLTNKKSFDNLVIHYERAKKAQPTPKIVIVGTKSDDVEHQEVNIELLQNFANEYNLDCYFSSARNEDENVCNLFISIIESLKNENLNLKEQTSTPTTQILTFNHEDARLTEGASEKTSKRPLLNLKNRIDALSNSENEQFIAALHLLRARLEKTNEHKIVDKTINFLNDYQNLRAINASNEAIIKRVADWEKECTNATAHTLKIIALCILTVIFVLFGVSLGAILGGWAGIMAGVWSGPGAALSGFLGLFTGSVTGWALAMTAASFVGGALGVASSLTFFGPKLLQCSETEKLVLEAKQTLSPG